MDSYEYSGLIIEGIVVILIVQLAIGYWASKKVETTNDYVLVAPSIMDFFQQRYGTTMSVVGSIAQIIGYFGWTAAQIVAGGAILQALHGWDLSVGMMGVGKIE
jgi:Na+/proline symporter